MNIFAAILICATSVPIQDCDEHTTVSVIYAPNTYAQPEQCQFEAMAYIAGTSLVHKGDVVKIYCGPRDKLHARFSKERLDAEMVP